MVACGLATGLELGAKGVSEVEAAGTRALAGRMTTIGSSVARVGVGVNGKGDSGWSLTTRPKEPRTAKATKFHEGVRFQDFPSCTFVPLVVN